MTPPRSQAKKTGGQVTLKLTNPDHDDLHELQALYDALDFIPLPLNLIAYRCFRDGLKARLHNARRRYNRRAKPMTRDGNTPSERSSPIAPEGTEGGL